MNNFSDFGIAPEITNFTGDKINVSKIIDKDIVVKDFKIGPSKYEGQRLDLQIEYKDEPRVVFTSGKYLMQTIEKIPKTNFPFKTKIIKNGEHLEFS